MPGLLTGFARAWDDTEVDALEAYAELVASLLGAAAKAEVTVAAAGQPNPRRRRSTP